jgi:TonB-dependent receptor
MKIAQSIFSVFLLLLTHLLFAQTGTLTGKLLDAKSSESIIGGTVRVAQSSLGCSSDLDGNFVLRNVPVGTHTLTVSYIGYKTKEHGQIEVKANQETYLSFIMEEETSGTTLKDVVIVADVRKESQAAITLLQRNSAMISDGISAQTIRLTPDRTTGDVIKRISGASIQDNKFAVIRGLADRYNMALLNGSPLTSTEPDRRAFSLDIFPSAMLDNLVVVKTASADMPGEWAGGAIMITTRDIPSKNFFNFSLSSGYNTMATFKQGLNASGGKRDWLGYDDGSRDLPAAMPLRSVYVNLPLTERLAISKQFENNWELTPVGSVSPNLGAQLSGGVVKKVGESGEWGTTFASTYSNNNSLQQGQRNDFDKGGQLFGYTQSNAQNNIALGVLINTAYKFNQYNKIGAQLLHSTNTTETISVRTGSNFDVGQFVRSNAVEFIENHTLTTRLTGDHSFLNGIGFSWSGGYNRMDRTTPNTRRAFGAKTFDSDANSPFLIDLPPGSATRDRGAIFYSDLNEDVYNFQSDVKVPFKALGQKQILKFGVLHQSKVRTFSARNLGYIKASSSLFDNSILTRSDFSNIFDADNIKQTGFVIDEITNLFDEYDASSSLNSGFIMMDNSVTERLKLSYGLRLEHFNQKLDSYDVTVQPVSVNQTYVDLLPSLNAKYLLNEKTNMRFSVSKTTSRPEFREIAPFPFYDFEELAVVLGNPALERSKIYNADLRYEIYPGGNQILSASAFYKYFNNPIEYTIESLGAGSSTRSYKNVPSAQNFGIELEARKNLEFLFGDKGTNWTTFANLALIQSMIDVSTLNTSDPKRPLQGQSPYVLNTGVAYFHPELKLNSMLIFNMIGDRLSRVGTSSYSDIYEKSRPVFDFSIVKDFGKSQLKFTYGDILRSDALFYQDENQNHKYDSGTDNVFMRSNRGSTISLTASVKI